MLLHFSVRLGLSNRELLFILWGFPGSSKSKESACNVGDLDSISGLGRFLGGGHDNPFQYSCQENSMDREAWRGYSPGVSKSRTQQSN